MQVHIGQVWRDNDKCNPGERWLKVLSVGELGAVAVCEVVKHWSPKSIGRQVCIRTKRFRPNSTGYTLVEHRFKAF